MDCLVGIVFPIERGKTTFKFLTQIINTFLRENLATHLNRCHIRRRPGCSRIIAYFKLMLAWIKLRQFLLQLHCDTNGADPKSHQSN
ncbi:hypothetical protein A9K58_09720 [Stenotrophomonas maltophilia]|uniref:Uncharacterized protein n=1 Tax=Stenotrophomonas maltophilia TaxID=40324 RepID=A0A1A6XV58_STEMA|nr:hypothetical protein A9K58_09720 [Stenotrophomonas maltophilia]